MAIFKSRDKWRAEVFANGERVASRSGFDRRSEAVAWYEERKAELKRGTGPTKPVSMDELISRFIAKHLPTIRQGTRTRYLLDIDQRIRPHFRFYRLDQITSEMIETFRLEISDKLKPKSVNNCLHTLRLILNKGVKWKLMGESPYDLDSLPVPKSPYPWWDSRDHIARFLEAAKSSRYYGVYLLALETGLRYGEIAGLARSAVDLKRGTIHVYRQWLERQKDFGPPKGGRERWVDFNPEGELGRLLSQVKSEIVFTTASGRMITKSGVADKYFRLIIKRAGIPRICFHGLRHTFASWYMRQHDNIWDLSAILGHADVATTQIYAHHSKRARRKPLELASVVTHKSLTREIFEGESTEDHLGKKWRDGRDLNPKPSNLKVV